MEKGIYCVFFVGVDFDGLDGFLPRYLPTKNWQNKNKYEPYITIPAIITNSGWSEKNLKYYNNEYFI